MADATVFKKKVADKTMKKVLFKLCDYIEGELGHGAKLNEITRHILGAFNGVPGARHFRQVLSENAHRPGAGLEVVKKAVEKISDDNI